MIERKIIADRIGDETRLAVLENGEPVELAVSYRDGKGGRLGNLYKARVEKLLKGMNAAFVNIGDEKNAFLSLDDLPPAARDATVGAPQRKTPLRAGDEIIVQIVKEPGRDKGPKVTMNPALAGRCAVLLPTMPSFGVSRKIEEEARREELLSLLQRAAPEGMGAIARTASENASEEEIREDLAQLQAEWEHAQALYRFKKAPALVHDESDLAARAARDLNCEVEFAPFDDAIESRIEKALRRRVWLDSGAFLVIDRCEAMTVIDVNSGKFTGKKNLETTLLKLNCEAAREIAKLVRLRDLGGIIVIDFVDMELEEDRRSVLEAFEQALAPDRAKRRIHGFTGAGLLEMTRRPLWGAAENELFEACPRCRGEGRIENPRAAAHALLRRVRRRRASGDESLTALNANGKIAAALREIGLPQNVVIAKEEAHEPQDDTGN